MIPFVEKRFRVLAAKDDRAIAGLSMGGGHTLAATNNNPGTFAYIGVFSSGPARVDEALQKQTRSRQGGRRQVLLARRGHDRHGARANGQPVGAREEGTASTRSYREIPGRHYWFLWRDFLAHYAQLLFR